MIDRARFGIDLEKDACAQPRAYADEMLVRVSRTFALCIGVLPGPVRRAVLLAYLFLRVADTVEDDARLPGAEKKRLLELYAAIFLPGADREAAARLFVDGLPGSWRDSAEDSEFLSAHPRWLLGLLDDLPERTVAHVSACVREMSAGMGEFALRQPEAGTWGGLRDVRELDRYCYFVAGVVGVMLTEIFVDHSPLVGAARADALRARAIDFGEGLQLVNIVKDAEEDSRRGISFLPEELCAAHGVSSKTMFDAENREGAMAVMRELSAKALEHLDRGFEYTLLLPRLEPRIRLFCLWALFMAAATLQRVSRDAQVLGEKKVKIARKEVKAIVRRTTLTVWSNGLLRRQYAALRAVRGVR